VPAFPRHCAPLKSRNVYASTMPAEAHA
jgi:hypothetical protein